MELEPRGNAISTTASCCALLGRKQLWWWPILLQLAGHIFPHLLSGASSAVSSDDIWLDAAAAATEITWDIYCWPVLLLLCLLLFLVFLLLLLLLPQGHDKRLQLMERVVKKFHAGGGPHIRQAVHFSALLSFVGGKVPRTDTWPLSKETSLMSRNDPWPYYSERRRPSRPTCSGT